MKTAIYSGTIPSTTFIERLILGLANQPDIELLLTGTGAPKTTYPPNVKVVAYQSTSDYVWLFIKYFVLLLFIKPSKLKPAFVTPKKGLFNRIKEFVKKAPVLYHNPDIFHIQWAKSLEEWMFLKETTNIKIVLSLRGAHINYSPLADEQLKAMYQRSFPKIDAFHAVSEAIAAEAAKYTATPLNYKVVYSGLNLAQFPPFTNKTTHQKTKIISVGRPHWIKSYGIALDAISNILEEHPSAPIQYEIIGGTNEELTYHIHDLNLNNHVTITENIPFLRVMEKIRSADILLMPSVMEGIANVVLEAMALGTLVVSSNCGGMPEVVIHNKTGLLFENRNVKDLVKTLKQAMTMDENTRKEIILQARTIIETQHNEQKMIEDMLSLYKDV